jgi:hypothetical protein
MKKMSVIDCGKKFKNLKWFKRFDKNNELDYLNYLIQYVEGYIHNQNIKLSKRLDKFDIYKELLKIENNLIFSDNNTISYFTKKRINNLAKNINL